MRPLTEHLPKILLPLSGTAFLNHQLQWLYQQKVTRVVFCLGHLASLVTAHLARSPWRDLIDFRVSDERQQALGTAGAVRLAIEERLLDGAFLTLYGDTLPDLDLRSAVDTWEASALRGMLTVYRVESGATEPTALVKDGRVTEFVRGHGRSLPLTHADYGVSGFHTESFLHLPVGVRSGFAAIHQQLARAGQLAAVDVGRAPHEIGSHEGYRALEATIREATA